MLVCPGTETTATTEQLGEDWTGGLSETNLIIRARRAVN